MFNIYRLTILECFTVSSAAIRIELWTSPAPLRGSRHACTCQPEFSSLIDSSGWLVGNIAGIKTGIGWGHSVLTLKTNELFQLLPRLLLASQMQELHWVELRDEVSPFANSSHRRWNGYCSDFVHICRGWRRFDSRAQIVFFSLQDFKHLIGLYLFIYFGSFCDIGNGHFVLFSKGCDGERVSGLHSVVLAEIVWLVFFGKFCGGPKSFS